MEEQRVIVPVDEPLVFHDLGYHSLADMIHFLPRELSVECDGRSARRQILGLPCARTAILTCVLFSLLPIPCRFYPSRDVPVQGCKLLTRWAFEYFDQTGKKPHGHVGWVPPWQAIPHPRPGPAIHRGSTWAVERFRREALRLPANSPNLNAYAERFFLRDKPEVPTSELPPLEGLCPGCSC